MKTSINNLVVCRPFKEVKTDKGGLALVSKKNELVPLYPVYNTQFIGSVNVTSDDIIYVKSECLIKQWAKEIFINNNELFILVPVSEIVLIDKVCKEIN